MSFDRNEFDRVSRDKAVDRVRESHRALEYLSQAAVKAELLTGSPQWDVFLSYLQSTRDVCAQQLAGFERVLVDPRVVNDDDMRRAKISAVECRARIETLDSVMTLPAQIMSEGTKARDAIRESENVSAA